MAAVAGLVHVQSGGACVNGEVLYLCRGGRYVFAGLCASPVTVSRPAALNTWSGWQTDDPGGKA